MHSKLQGNQTPLLSIIAPIRNEREYIFELIASFSKINDQRVELLISDNHSDDGSYEAIKNTEFENIKIVKPKYRLSPFDNHIFALNQSSGDFIFPVGGDDYITPEVVKLVIEELKPNKIIIPKLRSFDDSSGKTIEMTNLKKDVIRFFENDSFSIIRYLKFINYDQLIFIVCERKMLNHLYYIKPNTIEAFAVWSNLFVFSKASLKNIKFIDSVLMHKRYNKTYNSAGFADDQYATIPMHARSFYSIFNSFLYFKRTKNALQTFYLLFFNRYAVGFYSKNNSTQKVSKLLTFSPIIMFMLSPFLIVKNYSKQMIKSLKFFN
jgi:glycosyltransferase involved in cell wall biosynthesis